MRLPMSARAIADAAPLEPDPRVYPEMYLSRIAGLADRYEAWAKDRGREVIWPVKVRIHPAVIEAIDPRELAAALGDRCRFVEAPPLSIADEFWLGVEDMDQGA